MAGAIRNNPNNPKQGPTQMSGGSAAEESGDYSGYYAQPDNEGYAYHDPNDNSDNNDGGGAAGDYESVEQESGGRYGLDSFLHMYDGDTDATSAAPVATPDPTTSTTAASQNPATMAPNPGVLFSGADGTPDYSNGGMSGAQTDAFAYLKQLFDSYGLGTMAGQIQQYVQNGYSDDTISLMLADTPQYKARFAGNDARQKAGLARLAPAQYLQMEEEYKNLFRQYGLPEGMYDSQDDFVTYIGNDVSPQEMDSRLQIAQQSVRSDHPEIRDTYKAWYSAGLSEGDAIAAVLDPGRALPELERKQRAAAAGGAAQFYGLQSSQGRAEQLADQGVDQTEAYKGYQQVAGIYGDTKSIADMYGLDYTQTNAEDEAFFGDADATKKRRAVNEREVADFSGGGKVDSRSFGAARY